MKVSEYAIYDTKDNDICLGVFDINQVSNYFQTKKAHIYQTIYRNSLIKDRYRIERL